jgi:hypothetical protein
MPRTPDRHDGDRDETAVVFEDTSPTVTSQEGELRYSGSFFRMRDASGEFDPRTGGGLSEAQHNALRQLIHFIDQGPTDGWASGTFSESTYTGVNLDSEIWYEDNTKAKKIVELEITTYSGVLPTTEVWKIYDSDGSTVLVTLTDVITYSGVFEATRTRTWA